MKKAALSAGLLIAALMTTGCSFSFSVGGGDTAKVEDLFVDLICTTHTSVSAMTSTSFEGMTPEEMQAKSAEIQAQGEQVKKDLEALPSKYGFSNEAALKDAYNKIGDKEAFKKSVREKANAKCTPTSELMEGILNAQ